MHSYGGHDGIEYFLYAWFYSHMKVKCNDNAIYVVYVVYAYDCSI